MAICLILRNFKNKTTSGEAYSKEADEWVTYIQETYHVARPTMSVASAHKNPEPVTNTTTQPTQLNK